MSEAESVTTWLARLKTGRTDAAHSLAVPATVTTVSAWRGLTPDPLYAAAVCGAPRDFRHQMMTERASPDLVELRDPNLY